MTLSELSEFARSDPRGYRELERSAESYLRAIAESGDNGTNTAVRVLLLGLIAERERRRMAVLSGHERAKQLGIHIGRPKHQVSANNIRRTAHLTMRRAAEELGVSPALVCRLRKEIYQ